MTTALRAQLARARKSGTFTKLKAEAERQGVELALVLGIASRETNIVNEMGDHGHGHGVMQIDDRSWPEMCAKDIHTHEQEFIAYGVRIYLNNLQWARETWPHFTEEQHVKIAVSAYNCGRGGATSGVHRGDSDLRTTGRNYAHDVLQRTQIFRRLLKEKA